MSECWAAAIVVVVVLLGASWWLSGTYIRSKKAWEGYCESFEEQSAKYEESNTLARKTLELGEEWNRLAAEQNILMRELIQAMREKQ